MCEIQPAVLTIVRESSTQLVIYSLDTVRYFTYSQIFKPQKGSMDRGPDFFDTCNYCIDYITITS